MKNEKNKKKIYISYPVREVYHSFVANVLLSFFATSMDERVCVYIYIFSEKINFYITNESWIDLYFVHYFFFLFRFI